MSVDPFYAAFLGVVAGLIPVYLGIAPWRALRKTSEGVRTFLISFAIGVLLFLFVDVFHESEVLAESSGAMLGGALVVSGFVVGLLGLAVYESIRGRSHKHPRGYHPDVSQPDKDSKTPQASVSFAYLIALGIGLHNLGEGLAIGSSYAAGAVTLSYLLIIGFALHNGTEGFGIVAPIAKAEVRTRDPILIGLIAGGPTVLGAVLGALFYSDMLATLFFALAAGAILYVVIELIPIAYTREHKHLILVGVTIGMIVMYLTELLLSI
ncbi:MAG: ZIP family metal transporter [Promethearchaeati archaeon SRVP18_Atabeyarchaeia-1]